MNILLLAQEAAPDTVGFFTFLNILWVFVGLIFAVAVLGLFAKYLFPLIADLPPPLLEFVAWSTSLGAVALAHQYLNPVVSFIVVLICIPVMSAAVIYRVGIDSPRGALALMILYTGAAAWLHQSAFFGGLSVSLLLGLCGSWASPILSELGDHEEPHFVPSAFWSAAAILLATGAVNYFYNPDWLQVFKPGIYWLAGSVYSSGLMTLSCRYYHRDHAISVGWVSWQVVAIVSAIGGMYAGHTLAAYLGTSVLQELGGTFLAVYFIEKLAEIPWNFRYWPWIALLFAFTAYFAVSFATQHPDYFLAF